MTSEWREVRIRDIAEKVAMGPFGSSIKVSTFVHGGVPVISGYHLHDVRLLDDNFNFITEAHADRLKNSNVYPGDVIFTHAGNIGQVAFIPENARYKRYVLSQRQFYLRCNRGVAEPEFLAYYFKSREGQHILLANANSAGVPSIAQPVSYLKSVTIKLPPLGEQRGIAATLSALDDKIELNRAMIRNLEAMGEALFKRWFIEYEFPDENGQPYRSGGGVFTDSERGPIPAGWTVRKLGDVLELKYGKALKETDRVPGPYPVYGSNGPVGTHREALVRGPGIVVGRKGNPGTVKFAGQDFFPIDTTFYVKLKTARADAMNYYYYLLLFQGLRKLSSDSAVPGLNRNIVYMNRAVIAPEQVIAAFERNVKPLRDLIANKENEIRRLVQIRDTLLPRLMSGEIRVPLDR